MQIGVTVAMAGELQNHALAGLREKRAPVARVGFRDEPEEGHLPNVMTAFDADGDCLFDFAYRPHDRNEDYTDRHGLFFC